MNDILKQILANKTPEEFAAEMLEVRETIGSDNEYDISAEDALGVTLEPVFKTIILTRIETVSIAEKSTMPSANEMPFSNVGESYSLAA